VLTPLSLLGLKISEFFLYFNLYDCVVCTLCSLQSQHFGVTAPKDAKSWRLHIKLYKFGWNTFPNNARMNNRTDLNLGEVVYKSIIFHIPASWLNLLNGYDFHFRWRDTATQPYWNSIVRVLTLVLGSPASVLANVLTRVQWGAVTVVEFNLTMSDFCSRNFPRSRQCGQSFDAVVKEERSLMIKGKSILLLLDQGFLFFFRPAWKCLDLFGLLSAEIL